MCGKDDRVVFATIVAGRVVIRPKVGNVERVRRSIVGIERFFVGLVMAMPRLLECC